MEEMVWNKSTYSFGGTGLDFMPFLSESTQVYAAVKLSPRQEAPWCSLRMARSYIFG